MNLSIITQGLNVHATCTTHKTQLGLLYEARIFCDKETADKIKKAAIQAGVDCVESQPDGVSLWAV